MSRLWRSQKGAALVEYILVLPLLLLLFFGTLELFRLMSIKQSLRTAVKEAAPCVSQWKDYPLRCDPLQRISYTLDQNPFAVHVYRLEMVPSAAQLNAADYGELVEMYVEAEVDYGYLYPFDDGPTIILRESLTTFIDASPDFFELNPATPFPQDPGAR